MRNSISRYLNDFRASLNIDSAIKDDVARELYTHLQDRSQELEDKGVSKEEADRIATQVFGPPELVAEQVYDTYAQGNWQEALFTALPHFMVALLFASYYWQNIFCLSTSMATIVALAVYGWLKGKPIWLFPWLGYYLLPVMVTGMLLVFLPQGWGWVVAALIYIPLALAIIVYIVIQTARRDWLYTSLMLAPIPVIFSWLLSLGVGNQFLLMNDIWMVGLQTKIPWIVTSFLVLAAATITFIRIKPRRYKIIGLLVPPTAISVSVAVVNAGTIPVWGWLLLVLSLVALFIPSWIQGRGYKYTRIKFGSESTN
jgi:hypothetical protein